VARIRVAPPCADPRPGGASVALGVIWALWHLPLFFLPGSGSHGQSFPVYLLYATSLSVVMAWLYWKTNRSLLLVMIMHASVNNTVGLVPGTLPDPVGLMSLQASIVTWATVGLSSAVAVLLLVFSSNGTSCATGFAGRHLCDKAEHVASRRVCEPSLCFMERHDLHRGVRHGAEKPVER